jgi:hypothetical protein
MGAIGDETNLDINLKWLLQIVAIVGFAVWGYFTLTSQITQLEIEVLRMQDNVTMNSSFRIKWPLGELGSLPADAAQFMRLKHLEDDVDQLNSYVDGLRFQPQPRRGNE